MRGIRWFRGLTVLITASAVLLPLGIVLYQSVLDAPFFQPSAKLSTSAFVFVFSDPISTGPLRRPFWLRQG